MKSSVGVTICAVVVLIGSALALVGAAGAAFMFLGPLSGQLFDPANLPPGADLRMMRAAGLSGAVMIGAFGALGIATGIGLIRLWKWARYAAIVLGACVIVFSVIPGIAVMFLRIPPPSSNPTGTVPAGFRMVLAAFYFVWAALGGIFVYAMMRASTVAQFNGGAVEADPRVRPLSVSIIAWFMIASAAMGLPMMALTHLPAFLLGVMLTGGVAKAFYIVYFSLYVLLGIGLLKRTSEALTPSIGLHAFAIANALVMLVPSVWLRYQRAISSMSMMGGEPTAATLTWSRYLAVGSGVLLPGIIVYFLLKARRTLASAANQ